MRVLVTGATGFIGSHTARALLAEGHRVRLLVRSEAKARAICGDDPRVELAPGDMSDAEAVARAFRGCDAALHAAASVSLDPRENERLLRENVAGTRNVVGGAAERDVPVLYVSSLSVVFDPRGPDPGGDLPLTLSRSGYARSKQLAERTVRSLQEQGARIAIVYPNGVIGPDDPGWSEANRALKGFLRTTLRTSGGVGILDVRDLATFQARVLGERLRGRYPVGGRFFSWDELVSAVEPLLGRPIARMRAPGFALRAAGSAIDLVRRVRPVASIISREAMEYATRMRPLPNAPELGKLGVALRAPQQTFEDTLRWMLAAGRLRPEHAPGLVLR
jgi:nucleoside-diphosphate-sugar epimerase